MASVEDQMRNCQWERLSDFHGVNDFDRFAEWILDLTDTGTAEEIPALEPYLGANTFREKWFRHIPSGTIWRLVWPDAPFRGVFERLD